MADSWPTMSSRSESRISGKRSAVSARTTAHCDLRSCGWVPRASDQVKRLGSTEVHRISGNPPSTTPSLYKLAWLAEHEPEILKRTATVADVQAYLARRLVGRSVTSWASADPLGVVDMCQFAYAPALLDLVGLDEGRFPTLVPPGTIVGQLTSDAAQATGLPAGLPVVAGAGDGQCAGLGAAITEEGWSYLNLGTGVTLGRHSSTYRTSRAFRTLSSPTPGSWTLEAVVTSGAMALTWFGQKVGGMTPRVRIDACRTRHQ